MAVVPRQFHHQTIHFLRKSTTFADDDVTLTIGKIPAGSLIIAALSGVYVTTAFNGTTPILDIGTTATADYYASDLALGTVAFVVIDVAAASAGGHIVTADTTITATQANAGTVTAGAAEIVIAYIPDIDG